MNLDSIFKAYDIRGTYPNDINETIVKRIAKAYAEFVKPKVVAVGRDVRLSGETLQKAVIDGLVESGVKVVDIGIVPTELMYFTVGYYHYDGGIQVSASHNPAEFNGLKFVRGGVEAISSDTGLNQIKAFAEKGGFEPNDGGEVSSKEITPDYFDFLSKFVEFDQSRPLKIVANANFGMSGLIAEAFLRRIANNHIELIKLNFEPNGSFPKGRPDPLLAENRAETASLIRETKADFGVAWDADGDRCFIVDETGEFIEGSHLTALLAQHLLKQSPGEKIIYEPRNIWAVEGTVNTAGGIPVLNKAGHTFIKNRMKQEDALFAGEMSGHYYFRDFYYADNGLLPFILFLNLMANEKQSVSQLLAPFREQYVVSGEINFTINDKEAVLAAAEKQYAKGTIDRTDGLSVSFDSWRFNLRPSNTENLLRLNVEASDKKTCDEKIAELTSLIREKD